MPTEPNKPYHYGNLKVALVDGALELVRERGVRDFSVAELSRRLGVTVGAPYRHFSDRDALLVATAVRALGIFGAALNAEIIVSDPAEQRLATIAGAYVRFAAEDQALFDLIFGFGLTRKREHPALQQAWEDVERPLVAGARDISPDDADGVDALVDAVEATMHGYAALLLDHPTTPVPEAIERSAAQAARTVHAVIQGRFVLARSG
jgi:AcrR family transcriptional regulator